VYTVDSADQRYFFDKTSYLLKQRPYKLSLYYAMMHLMEEKRLKVEEITPWKPTLKADFESGLKTFKSDSVVNSLDDLIVIMKHFEALDKNQITDLKALTSSHNTYLGILASATLLKHKQVVAPTTLNGFVEDVYDRLTLYDQFEKDNLLQHYPKAYLNQDSLAVSQIYSYLQEDGFVPAKVSISYAGLEDFDGQRMKFYVVKIYDEESDAWYRGVVGPFDPKKLSTWGALNTVDFEDINGDDKQYLRDYIAASVEAMAE